jgi:hypothetical protein
MLVNEYRLEIQFKKVRKVRNINNIPIVGFDHWNVGLPRTYSMRRTDITWSLSTILLYLYLSAFTVPMYLFFQDKTVTKQIEIDKYG